MNLVSKLALAAIAVGTFAAATPAQADWHGRGHYYNVRHYWHGRWWAPGYYGPTVFVGAPYYWSGYAGPAYYDGPYYGPGPRVSVSIGGGGYSPRGYWYHRPYYRRHHHWW